MTFLQSNAALIPYVAAIGAAAAAIGVLAYKAYEARAAVDSLRLDAAVNQFQLSATAAASLRDEIERLGNVSASNAEAIAKPFLQMGRVGGTIAEMLAPAMKQLATEMGGDVGGAAKELAERFVDLDTKGLAFVQASRSLTQAQKEQFAELVATGQRMKAYAELVDISTRSLTALRNETTMTAAVERDHARAAQLAASAGYSLEDAQKMVESSAAQAKASIEAETTAVNAHRLALLAASSAADNFAAAMKTAFKVDTIGAGIKATADEIKQLQAGLAAAPDHTTQAAQEMMRALSLAQDKMKGLLQQQADPSGLGRNLTSQTQDAMTHLDNTWRGSTAARLQSEIQMNRAILANDSATNAERAAAQKNIESLSKQLYDSQTKAGVKAAHDVLGAQLASIEGQIRAQQELARTALDHAAAEVKLKIVTPSSGESASIAALKKEQEAVDALYSKELALAGLTATKKQELANQELAFNDRVSLQIQQAQEKAAEASQKAWDTATKQINSAFDSQINGLLRGTTSWSQALRNVLASLTEDLVKFFVNWTLQLGETYARDLLLNNARVANHLTGNAAIAASDAGAAASGAFASIANAMKAIEADAARAFGGVFAFLAPIMGPAAAGPAAGASAAVLGAGASIASADIGMWSVPHDMLSLVHHNELIMPATQAGAFRDMLTGGGANGGQGGGGVSIHPTTNLNISAVDRAGVAQFFRDNQRDMMHAINGAVRQGAHLGLRKLNR